MNPSRLHPVALSAALLLPLLAPAASEPDERVGRHAAALADYETGHWARAYRALVALAEQDHPPAARLALLMATRGPALYGQAFEASRQQRRRWAMLQMPPVDADFFAAESRLASR